MNEAVKTGPFIKYAASWIIWPLLLASCTAFTAYGFSIGHPLLSFNIAYLTLALCLLLLEYFMPHETEWRKPDGQTFANIAHTLTSKGVIQGLVIFGGFIGLSGSLAPLGNQAVGIWPQHWPYPLQILLTLAAAEFALYWAHRLAHTRYPLWRFHAVHHNVTKLWIINTGRFHFIDSLVSISLGSLMLLLLGAPAEMFQWLAALTAFLGMLTHCNVEMRPGPLSYLFNTPELHRWHHSRDLREGNKNFGENLVLWDQLFGTFYNPNRRPPANIGIDEFMPPLFIEQIIWPFIGKERRRKIRARYKKQS